MQSRSFGVRAIVAVALVGGAVGCGPKPLERPFPAGPVKTGAGTIAEARKYLEGRWTMVSLDLFPPNEKPIKVVGSGTLIYDEFGNMDVQIKIDEATTQQVQKIGIKVPGGVISEKGQTLVDMTGRTLRFVREGEDVIRPIAHPLDIGLPRHWEVEGNTLTLRTKDQKGTILSVGVWRKES